MEAAQFQRLLKEVRDNTCKILKSNESGLSAAQFAQLCRALQTNSSVRTLQLDAASCLMSDSSSARMLSDMLAENCSITKLQLWNIPADAPFAAELARGLQSHPTLEILKFHTARFTPTSGRAIFAALRHCTHIKQLRFEHCVLEVAATKTLVALLHALPELSELDLSFLMGPSASFRLLMGALDGLASLCRLKLDLNSLDTADVRCLAIRLWSSWHADCSVIQRSRRWNFAMCPGVRKVGKRFSTRCSAVHSWGSWPFRTAQLLIEFQEVR